MANQLTFYTDSAEGWERSLMAFLAEKERRTWGAVASLAAALS